MSLTLNSALNRRLVAIHAYSVKLLLSACPFVAVVGRGTIQAQMKLAQVLAALAHWIAALRTHSWTRGESWRRSLEESYLRTCRIVARMVCAEHISQAFS